MQFYLLASQLKVKALKIQVTQPAKCLTKRDKIKNNEEGVLQKKKE